VTKVKAPFFAVDPRWWPTVADHLPRPWPADAVKADLRWWEDQVSVGFKKRIPGRPTLRARWGWSDHQVREMLKDEASWRDLTCKESPANRQPTASESPADRQQSGRKPAESQDRTASESPASRQPDTRKTPHARSTQHTTHNTHPQEGNKGERGERNLSTESDPLARFAALLWRKHYIEIMGFPYKPTQSQMRKMLPHLREMAQIAGCDRESTVDTVEGHRLNGAIKHYITAAKAKALWTHKTGDAPCPRTMRQHHLADSLAAAPRLRCRNCEGRGFRHGAYLVSTGDRVETHNFPCGSCKPDALATQRAELEAMGRVEGKTFWVQDVYPHEKHYGAYCALVQGTETAPRGNQ